MLMCPMSSDLLSPVLDLRPTARRFLPDALRRLRSTPAIWLPVLAGLAAIGVTIAFGHSWAMRDVGIAVVVAILLGVAYLLVWYRFAVFGTRWRLYVNLLSVSRPGARELTIPLKDVAAVRLETIAYMGIQDPVLVFEDRSGTILFWTVAGRWANSDLDQLWTRLGFKPTVGLGTIHDYQTMPYDRRY